MLTAPYEKNPYGELYVRSLVHRYAPHALISTPAAMYSASRNPSLVLVIDNSSDNKLDYVIV